MSFHGLTVTEAITQVSYKKAWECNSSGRALPGKSEALSSHPNTAHKKSQVLVILLVILPTWETELRRIMVGSHPGQKVLESPISNITMANRLEV
jgi:hypothetical protein